MRPDQLLTTSFKEIGDLKAALDEHVIVAIANPEGRITSVNARFCAISQYAREELIDQDHRIINPDLHSQEFVRELQTTLARGQVWHGEIKNRAKDGSFYWVDTTIVPFVDEHGPPKKFVAVGTDITEGKRTEAALRESEGRYRTLFEQAPDGIVIADAESNYLDANASICRMLGYTRDELIGLHATDIVVPAEAQHIEPALSAIKAKSAYHREWRFRRKDGSVFAADVIATLMPDGNLLGMIRDITGRKRAESALEDSHRRFLDMLKDVELIAMTLDRHGVITFCNDFLLRLTGWNREEVIGQMWYDKFVPDSAAASRNPFLDTVDLGKIPLHHQNPIKTRTGELREIHWNNTLLRDATGEIAGTASIGEDITERKRTEEALRQGEQEQRQLAGQLATEKARLVAAQAVANVGSWEMDLTTGAATWSDETHRIFESWPEKFRPTRRRFLQLVHAGDRASVKAAFVRSLGIRSNCAIEHRLQLPDGRIKIVEEHWRVFFDDNERPLRAVGTCQDITSRKQAEQALRESEERFRTIFEQAPLGISESEIATARIVSTNRRFADILGYTIAELRVLTFKDYTHPDDLPKDLAEFRKLAAGEIRTYATEKRFFRKDGTIIWVNLTVSGLAPAGGKPINCMAVIEDITARKQAEVAVGHLNADLEYRVAERTSQLEAANKELAAFTYSISHDLRAPLRAMDGYARAVIEEFGPSLPEEGRRFLATIRMEAQQMANLIDDLLEFSRLGRQPLLRQSVTTDRLVRAALDELRPEQKGRQIEIRIGDLPPCQGDPALLKQVWLNLLSNALKYTLKCPQAAVEIGCTSRDGGHTYFVRDNGAGFDMRYAEKLFGVFQRLHRAEDYAGTGVGLAIVQRIVHRHGGLVWAEAAVGRGATFYFTLGEEVNDGKGS